MERKQEDQQHKYNENEKTSYTHQWYIQEIYGEKVINNIIRYK